MAHAEASLVRLTTEQMRILDYLAFSPRLGITGAAGTGKTLVAMERAARLAAEGQRVLLLCFNKGHDAVIVDEGQDFAELWWVAVEELLRDRGMSSLWVFYDPKPDIFGRDGLRSVSLQPAELPYVCRNTEAIARFSHAFIGSEPRLLPGMPPGTQVESVSCATVGDMREAVRKALHRLGTTERFAPERIVVLSPRSAQRSQLCGRTFGNFRLVESPTTAGEIRYASLQSFKGLRIARAARGSPASFSSLASITGSTSGSSGSAPGNTCSISNAGRGPRAMIGRAHASIGSPSSPQYSSSGSQSH